MTTRNPQEAKARQSIIEDHYKLKFFPYLDPQNWPQQHALTFDHIKELGVTRFNEWKEVLHANWRNHPWKLETEKDVDCIVQKARKCLGEGRNELGWRMALEPLLFKRFDHGASCKHCGVRLRRSAIETIVNQKEESTTPLKTSIKEKKLCRCPSDGPFAQAAIMHTLFSSREDAFIKHDPIAKDKLDRKGERPDKIYTLRRTGTLYKLLRSPSIASNGLRTLEAELEPTLFPTEPKPSVFPFLVMESKSAKGCTFEEINQQMAIVIFKSLSIQQRLHASTCSVKACIDGPLCWSLSHIGARWRLAAGYEANSTRRDFEVATLWSGDIDQPDGALQLLLILEYICDWARYVYRESIKRGLKTLTSLVSDTMSQLSLDCLTVGSSLGQRDLKDFLSPNPVLHALKKLDRIGSWTPEMNAATPEDPFKQFDSGAGIIRDAKFVHSQVMGLCITESNFELLINCVDSDKDAGRLLRKIRKILRTNEPLLMVMSDLKGMEIAWAGTSRDFWEGQNDEMGSSSEELFHVLLTFSAFITPEWELKRELCYLAISESAMSLLFQGARRSRQKYPIGERISPDAIAKFIGRHNSSSVEETLTACLYRSSNCPRMRKLDSDISSEILFKDRDFIYFVEQSQDEGSRGFVWSFYLRHKVGRNEPTIPLLRLSCRKDQQALLNRKAGHKLSPWATYNIAPGERAVLAHSSEIEASSISQQATDCIFVLDRVHTTNLLALTNISFQYGFITERATNKDPQEITWNMTRDIQEKGASRIGEAILAYVRKTLKLDERSDSEIASENASDEDYETESTAESEDFNSDESEDQITDDEEDER